MDANPTAEALARLLFDHAAAQGFPVAAVRFWETPTSFATYSRGAEEQGSRGA
jgi:6-pyruvoyltetrahydropterin/6-carboxytetrahydropterin synthase